MIGYFAIFFVVLLTVYSQIVFKWRMLQLGSEHINPISNHSKLILTVLFDPFILSGYISAFLVSILWIFVLKNFQLSYAYVFLSLPLVLVSVLSYFIFGENLDNYKIFGMVLIVLGILIVGIKGQSVVN